MNTKKIKSICVVPEGYPAEGDPFFPFVELLCKEFARQGIQVTVICPQSIVHCLRRRLKPHPKERIDEVEGGIPIKVYQPYFFSIPYKYRYTNYWFFKRAACRQFRKLNIKPDILYSHFWYPGFAINEMSKKRSIPLFVATGESNLKLFEKDFSHKAFMEYTKNVKGVICVSSENLKESVRMGLTKEENCLVIPNAVDDSLFHKRDKNELRKKYGINEDDFIVCFVGAFINRKGSNRLSDAIDKLNDSSIKSFFIGGSQGNSNLEPTCPGVLKKGKVNHDELFEYLCMSDIFVLPTLHEGCCNAIVEALACGLPVVSSDRSFNYDILNETNSIMIDPNSVDAIADAIKELKDNSEKRERLAAGALAIGKELTITKRAEKIIRFIEKRMI